MRLLTTTDWTVKRGMLLAGAVVAVCALLSFYLSPIGLFVLAIGMAMSCIIPWFRHPIWVYIAVWSVVFLCLFGARRLLSVDRICRQAGQQDTIVAKVVELPRTGSMVTVEIRDADKLSRGDRVLLYCNEQVMPKQNETVRATVELKKLYDTQQNYRADGVFLQAYPIAYEEDALTVVSTAPHWRNVLSSLRECLLNNIRTRLDGEEGALLGGICLGDRSGISDATMLAFRRTGMPHILVVSGLHLSVIAVGVYGFLRLVLSHRRLAAALTMVVVVFFMLLVGLTPSVMRAGVMCLTMLGGQLFTRRSDGLNSMGLALIILLAINPYSLTDAGLQLSFGAAGGVLCLTKPMQQRLYRLPLWRFVADGLAVTLAGTLPILPLLGYYFGEVSVVSPLANLLAVTTASVALAFGWVGALIALIPPFGFLANGILYIGGWLMRWLLAVAHTIGALPFATLPTARAWTILYLTGGCGLVILCLCKMKRGTLLKMLAVLATALTLACVAEAVLQRGVTTVCVTERDEAAMLMLEQDGRRGLIATNVSAIYANDAFVTSCRGSLDFVVVMNGEPKDAARLTELLRRVSVRALYIGADAACMRGLNLPAAVLDTATKQPLWEDTVLSVDADGEWQLDCRGTTLAIMPKRAGVADGAIFIGAPIKGCVIGQGVLLMDEADAATQTATEWPFEMTVLTKDSVYLTTRGGGEWSVERWR